LLGVQILFGLHYLAGKTIVQTIPPRPWALIRASSAGLLLLFFLLARRTPLPRGPGTFRRFLGLGLIGVAINQWLFVEGLSRTTPGHSALINTSMPVLVVLIALVMGRERPTPVRLAGIAITMAGVLWLVAPGHLDWHAGEFRGDLLTTLNSLSYSLFLVVSKPVFEREKTLPAAALLLLCGALWLVPVGAPGLLTLDFGAIGARTWLLGAFIVLGPTVGAYALNTYALKRLDSSVVAFFIFLQPLIATTLSIARGYEKPTLRLFIAAAIVFTGVLVALRAPAVRAAPPVAPES
jgi:drug/metabolite transporter (DMT)-like permease